MTIAQGILQYLNVDPILVGLRLQHSEGGRLARILDKIAYGNISLEYLTLQRCAK